MPRLTDAEREAFLNEPGILLKIGTVRPNGTPSVVPIWFVYEEGRIWFTPRRVSEWLAHIRANPSVALCIDEPVMPYRKLLVEGRAEIVHDLGDDDVWRDRYRRIARRYVPEADADAYVDGTDDQTRTLCAVTLAEATVKTWRMPVGDEPYNGIWAKRYWTEDAKVRSAAPDVIDRSVGH